MSNIPTWRARAEKHPDHQSGMISEGMIRARMEEEIEDLRAEVEELSNQIYESIPKWQSNEMQREINRLRDARTVIERERDRARADHDALRGAAREYLETLGGAMKSGKFEMAGTAEMAHFVRQAMQKLDSLVFDRAGPRPVGLEKLHEPHGRAS